MGIWVHAQARENTSLDKSIDTDVEQIIVATT